MAPEVHYVYRHLDSEGRVLYVGCTTNIERRTSQHRYSPWHPFIARVAKRKVIGRIAALESERTVIRREQPPYNMQKKGPKRKPPSYDHAKWLIYRLWRIKRVAAMRGRGMMNRKIGEKLGMSMAAVSNAMRRAREYGLA